VTILARRSGHRSRDHFLCGSQLDDAVSDSGDDHTQQSAAVSEEGGGDHSSFTE
jgi:hypothetical protein